ncbi:hypothetical protein BC833DRAFT_187770 [Globomyces pollinis-pini]|nr:hypothetical protein BC833DRAFT_187770 [Globomyces pollinis-pini]
MADEDMNLTEQIKQLTDSTIESFITEAFKVSEKSTSQMYQIHLDGVHQQSKWQFKSITSDVEISLKCPETSKESNRQIWGARGKKFIQHTPKSIFDTVKSVTDHTPHLDPLFKNGKVVKTIFSEQNEIGEEIDAAEVSLLRYTMGIPLVSDRVFLYLERRKKVQVQILAEDGSISTKNAYVVVLNSLEDDGSLVSTSIPKETFIVENGTVHGKLYDTGYLIMEHNNGSFVSYVVQADPCGWLPPFIINMFCHEQPMVLNTLEKYLNQQ